MQVLNPGYLFGGQAIAEGFVGALPGVALFLFGAFAASVTLGAAKFERRATKIRAG